MVVWLVGTIVYCLQLQVHGQLVMVRTASEDERTAMSFQCAVQQNVHHKMSSIINRC
jgi:hypothetical protein